MVVFEDEVALDRLEVFATGLDHPEGIAVTPAGPCSWGVRRGKSTGSATTAA